MKNLMLAISLWLALLAVGCNTLQQNQTQLQVVGPPANRFTRAAVSSTDKETAKQIVADLAKQWNLQDRTADAIMTNALALYSQDWNKTPNPYNLIVFEHQGRIIVDLTQNSPEIGETPLFRVRQDQLLAAFRDKFGDRAVRAPVSEWVRHVAAPQ